MYFTLAVISAISMKMSFSQLNLNSITQSDTLFYFTDKRDDNKYKVIFIDTMIWMAEPMKFKVSESTCFNGKVKNCEKYGRLYSFDAATKACPPGWRLPSNEDWNALINFLGGDKKAGSSLMVGSPIGFINVFGYPPNVYGRYAEDNSELHFWSSDVSEAGTAWNYYLIRDKLPLISSSFLSVNYKLNCTCVRGLE